MKIARRSPSAAQARGQLLPPARKRRDCTDNLWLLTTPLEGAEGVAHSDPMMGRFYYLEGWHSVQEIHCGSLATQVPCVQGGAHVTNVFYAWSPSRVLWSLHQAQAAGASKVWELWGSSADLDFHVMRIDNWRRVIPCMRRIRPHLTGALERHFYETVHQRSVSIAELLARQVAASLMLGYMGLLLRRGTIQSDLDERPGSLHTRLWKGAMSGGYSTRRNTDLAQLNLFQRPWLSVYALQGTRQQRFSSLCAAVTQYVAGGKLSGIELRHGLCRETLPPAFYRCLFPDLDGLPLGGAALLPGVRLHPNKRRALFVAQGRHARAGRTGACSAFFETHRALKQQFDKCLLKIATQKGGYDGGVRHFIAQRFFIKLCDQHHVDQHSWSLSTEKLVCGAICCYVQQFLTLHFDAIVKTQYGSAAQSRSLTGSGVFLRLRAGQILDVIELDEHLCDFSGWVEVEAPGGGRWIRQPRLTLLAAIDQAWGLGVGFNVIVGAHTNAEGVLDTPHCISSTLMDQQDAALNEPAMSYQQGDRFSCYAINQLIMDNALSHLSDQVHGRGRALLGCNISFCALPRADRRPTIEALFGQMARAGSHRLQETTGSGPRDTLRHQRQAPGARQLTQQQAVALIIYYVYAFSGGGGKDAYGPQRIEHFAAMVDDAQRSMFIPALAPSLAHIPRLDKSVVRLKVRGSADQGRGLVAYYKEEEYFGEVLSQRMDLIGSWVDVHIDRGDIRQFAVFSCQGIPLGTACVRGCWRHCKHSLRLRVLVDKLIRNGQLRLVYDEDPISAHVQSLQASGCAADRNARTAPRAAQGPVSLRRAVRSKAAADRCVTVGEVKRAGRSGSTRRGAAMSCHSSDVSTEEDGDETA